MEKRTKKINKCCRCEKQQEGINNICGLPVCKDHSNMSNENTKAIIKILHNKKTHEKEN